MSTMPLKDGVYIITNVKQRNSVFLENPDDETPLRGNYRQDALGERWQVIDRGNGQHSILNVGFQRYANSGTLAGLDAFVEGRDREQLWYIQERSKGKYTIATTDSGNYWMLPDNQLSTPVGLLDKPTDQRCWWIFTDPETEAPLDDRVSHGAVLFELKMLPIVPFSPLRLDFVIIQGISDDSVSNATKTIGEIYGALVSSTRRQPDTLRVNVIEFEPFESSAIFFRRFTGFSTVENLCHAGDANISWQRCRGSSLPEPAIRGLRTDATKIAILNLDITLLQQSGHAIIKLINSLVKQNITLILTPIQPTFYDSDTFRELQNLSFESQPFEQMDEFTDYIVNYNEMVALPRLIANQELREAFLQTMPHIVELLRDKDHDTRSSAITALSSLAEHVELHDIIRQATPRIMEVLKDEDHDARSAAVAALSKLAKYGASSKPRDNAADGPLKGKFYEVGEIPRDSSGRTPLSWAAGNGYDAVVRLLLVLEGDINTVDNTGRTPLSWAAEGGHNEVVKLLLAQKGVNVNFESEGNDTPLTRAAHKGRDGVTRQLLAHENVDTNAKTLTAGQRFRWQLEKETMVVKLLLGQKVVNADFKSKGNDKPLMGAAHKGHGGVARQLLAPENVDIDAKNINGRTPLSWAAGEGHDEVVRLLLNEGVDINSKSANGDTPLAFAASNGCDGIIRMLLAHKDVEVDTKGNFGRTPLSLAAGGGHGVAVHLLLKKEGIDINSKTDNGDTPLILAAAGGHSAVVRLLLARKDVNVDIRQTHGRTPLSAAAGEGRDEVVKLLLAQKGVDINSKENAGRTPLSLAAAGGHDVVVRLLLAHKDTEVDAKSNSGRTPLSWAAEGGHDEVVELLLAQKGVNANSKNKGNDTPLSWAACKGHGGVVRLLLAHKNVGVDVKNGNSRTPLSLAAEGGYDEVVKLLLAHKDVNVNSKSKINDTPLLLAAFKGHAKVVRLLLAHKNVDVDAKNGNGRTALLLAARGGHDEVVQLLQERIQQRPGNKLSKPLW